MNAATPPSRRLILLTRDGREHRYMANRLCRELPVEAIIVDERERRPKLARAFRGGIRRGSGRLALFAFRKVLRDRQAFDAAVRRVLGEEETARFAASERVIRVDGINSDAAVAAISTMEPDTLLVFGTSIVKAEILGLARDVAFNLHTGLSPRYRGTDCAFWPIVNREPECLGATVHECTAEIDGGRIFGAFRVVWQPDDGIHELFARAVATGADLYIETVRRYLANETMNGMAQDLSEGQEYRGYMRTLWPELRARWLLRRGILGEARRDSQLGR